jgi:Pentapeptide repeats (8 copies)
MPNDEHITLLKKGVATWNAERNHPFPDLRGADLSEANLSGANLSMAQLHEADLSEANLSGANLSAANLLEADLSGANLSGANLSQATFQGADLRWATLLEADLGGANLSEADLRGANLSGANLTRAQLPEANLRGANLSGVNLSGANLQGATLLWTDLTAADLTGCRVHGVSAWSLKLERTKQQNLVITRPNEPTVTVDNIEVAQFVYLLLHNEKIRDVIDTIGKKGVLLLGRFTGGRMAVLERLRDKLRELGYVPMVFNFDKPETKDFSETVRLLCNLSHFVIVDITNPRSAPLELQATVPDYMIPFVPILQDGEEPFAMFVDLQNKYDWVLQPVIGYPSVDRLIEVAQDKIVSLAEAKFNELLARRTNRLRVEIV